MISDVFLDSSTASLLTQRPGKSSKGDECQNWLVACLRQSFRVHLPEIVDYEVRREYLRANRALNLARLDALKLTSRFLSINSDAILRAAHLWAQARNNRQQTAPNMSLDIDVILVAQTLTVGLPIGTFVVATDNVDHLSRFVPAARWQDI